MKKIFAFAGLIGLLCALYACGSETTTSGSGNTTTSNSGGNTTTSVTKKKINLRGEEFRIVANNVEMADPRKSTYEGINKEEKMERIEYVEKEYNCKVVYVSYPVGWGEGRDNWIIENSIAGTPYGHVFETASYSIFKLALKKAIIPLDEFITEYELDDTIPKLVRDYGTFKGKTYGIADNHPFSDSILLYNRSLLEELGYTDEQMPASLYHRGEWTWDKYKEYATNIAQKFQGTNKYVMTGRGYDWAYQMIAGNGGVMVDSDLNVKINSNESIEAMQYIADLYKISDRVFKDDAPMQDTCDQVFKDGNAAFTAGKIWWCFDDGRLGKFPDKLDAVPYPVKNTSVDYKLINEWGAATYVISSGYDISTVPPGYEHLKMHGETIFQIWTDLQYFMPIDEAEEYYVAQRYEKAYYSEESVLAHRDVMSKVSVDLFYSLIPRSFGDANCYAYQMEEGMRKDNVRAMATSLYEQMMANLEEYLS